MLATSGSSRFCRTLHVRLPALLILLSFSLLHLAVADSVAAADHYAVLGIEPDASQADIKKMYKKLALRYHPDKNPAEDAQKQFIQIQKSYEVLSDPQRRQAYNARRGFFSEDDVEHGEEFHAPDHGAGKVFSDMAEYSAAIASDDLWLMHVYIDSREMFGHWMAELPNEIRLGHVNLQRSDEFVKEIRRMFGGRQPQVPLLMLCQKSECEPFGLTFQAQFFGIAEFVIQKAVNFIDYPQYVNQLGSDDELSSFAAFHPRGTSVLRVVAIVEDRRERHFDLVSLAMRMGRQVRVAQVCYYDLVNVQHRLGEFVSSLNIRRLPAVTFIDPLTHDTEVLQGGHAMSDLAVKTEQIIHNDRMLGQMYPIQELTLDAHRRRCAESGGGCEWIFVFAVSDDLELKPRELSTVMKKFAQACKTLATLRDHISQVGTCFSLRLSHAPGWASLLKEHNFVGRQGGVLYALGRGSLTAAPGDSYSSFRMMLRWFQTVMALAGTDATIALDQVDWPPLPPTVLVEPQDWRSQISTWMEQSFVRVGLFLEITHRNLQVVMEMDTDRMDASVLSSALFAVLAVLALVWAIVELAWPPEEEKTPAEALAKVDFLISVRLSRSHDTKFGLSIAPAKEGLRVKEIMPGGLLDAWNAAEERDYRRVREGDVIRRVTICQGKKVHHVTATDGVEAMGQALRETKDVELVIAATPETKRDLRRVTGTAVMKDLVLQENVTLTAPTESPDLEVATISPQVEAWNRLCQQAGVCCTQRLEVGDRIVAVNGHTEVETHLGLKSPVVVHSRWLPSCSIVSHRFEVTLQRSDAKQHWGMQFAVDVENERVHVVTQLLNFQSPISAWNQNQAPCNNADMHPSHALLSGDRIISINTLEGQDALLELKRALKVLLCCERWQLRRPDVALSGQEHEQERNLGCSHSAEQRPPTHEGRDFEFDFDDLDITAGAARVQECVVSAEENETCPSRGDDNHLVCKPPKVIQDSQPELCTELGELDTHMPLESSGWDLDFELDDLEVTAATACMQQHAEPPVMSLAGRDDDHSGCMNVEVDAECPLPAQVAQDAQPELSIECGGLDKGLECLQEATHKPMEGNGWNFDFDLNERDTTRGDACVQPSLPAVASGSSHSGRSADHPTWMHVGGDAVHPIPSEQDDHPELSIEPRLDTGGDCEQESCNTLVAQDIIVQPCVTSHEKASDNDAWAPNSKNAVTVGAQILEPPSSSALRGSQHDVPVCLGASKDFAGLGHVCLGASEDVAGLGHVSLHATSQANCRSQWSQITRKKLAPKFHIEAQVSSAPFDGVDSAGEWLRGNGCVVLVASGPPAFIASIQHGYGQLRQSGCTAGFYREERLPIGSLLVVHVRSMTCRWFPGVAKASFPDSLLSDVESCSLPIKFQPQDFAARNFGACLGQSVNYSSEADLRSA